MESTFQLPKNRQTLEAAFESLVQSAATMRNAKAADWLVNYFYLQGIRNFPEINYREGRVRVQYTDSQGARGFRFEEVATRYQAECGRLMRIDVAPSVQKKGHSLDSLRKKSVSQVVLDDMFSPAYLDYIKAQLIPLQLSMGTVGIAAWTGSSLDGIERSQLEIIPPWQLLPIPSDVVTMQEVKGIVRTRWVPLEWAKKQTFWKRLGPEDALKLKNATRRVAWGETIPTEGSPQQGGGGGVPVAFRHGESSERADDDGDTAEFVSLDELWLYDEWLRVSRYVIRLGGIVVRDETHPEGLRPPMSLGVIHYNYVGGFYGRSFVDPLIPLNSEIEKLLRNLFKNIQDIDLFGMAWIPTTAGVNIHELRASKRPKAMLYEPDLSAPEHKPFRMDPVNSGPLPGTVANMALQIFERLAQQSEIFRGEAPGRVDSARGLGLLLETAAIPLGGPAQSIATAFNQVYSASLYEAKRNWGERTLSTVTLLDDSLAGLVLTQEGTVMLGDNAIPDPTEVEISVRSKYPRSPEQRKRELDEALQRQLITPQDYRIQARKEGLDLPLANDAEWENYRQATINNITLFGDGDSPGKVIMSESDNHLLHLQRLIAFMSRPEFKMASMPVRDAFFKHLRMRQEALGKYPEALERPEELLAMGQQALQEAGFEQGGGGEAMQMAASAQEPLVSA